MAGLAMERQPKTTVPLPVSAYESPRLKMAPRGWRRRRQDRPRRRDQNEEKRDGAHQEAELGHVVAPAPLHAPIVLDWTGLDVCWQRHSCLLQPSVLATT